MERVCLVQKSDDATSAGTECMRGVYQANPFFLSPEAKIWCSPFSGETPIPSAQLIFPAAALPVPTPAGAGAPHCVFGRLPAWVFFAGRGQRGKALPGRWASSCSLGQRSRLGILSRPLSQARGSRAEQLKPCGGKRSLTRQWVRKTGMVCSGGDAAGGGGMVKAARLCSPSGRKQKKTRGGN